jgi:class 3 adenylate cyclase
MFCDLVGSTPLSARLDPEDLRAAVRAYHKCCTDIVARYGGHVAQHLGDGLLVYFGYPAAHGDDAARAVHAGLDIVSAIGQLTGPVIHAGTGKLAVRVGIHTGLVVIGEVGDGGRRENLAIGETPNVAARLQGIASPGAVVISAATHRLVHRLVQARDLGEQTLKGLPAPIRAHEVLAAAGPEQLIPGPLVPRQLIGRDRQLAMLVERWEVTTEGRGQIVLLVGEPGIGKSRLVDALHDHLGSRVHTRVIGRCSALRQHSPLHAITDLLSGALGLSTQDAPEARLRTLETWLRDLGVIAAEPLPLLAGLLGLTAPASSLAESTPQRRKQQTFQALITVVQRLAGRGPVLLIIEDLHWADPSTLEFLSLLVQQIATVSVCAVFTARTEFTPPWPARSHFSQLTLDRLGLRDAEAILQSVCGNALPPPETLRQILGRADGVPLFLEELVRAVLEAESTGPAHTVSIPSTLQDSLMARLDRLGPARTVAQVASALGREFTFKVLQHVTGAEATGLERDLRALVDTEMLFQKGLVPDSAYVFKHALIQQAAYESLLRSARQQCHARIAAVLEREFPDLVGASPELLAHHCTEGGLTTEAARHWHSAGGVAVRRAAPAEAIAHFRRGLEVLATLPDTEERLRQELPLLNALGAVLLAARGFAAPETIQTYARARELCDRLGEVADAFPALWAQAAFLVITGDVRAAMRTAERVVALAQKTGDPGHRLQAHHAFWLPAWNAGRVAEVVTHCRTAVSLYDPDRHRELRFAFGAHDAIICGRVFEASALWACGLFDSGRAAVHHALTEASELRHPTSSAVAHLFAAMFYMLRRETTLGRRQAEACIEVCTEYGFPQWLSIARGYRGVARVSEGDAGGLEEIRQGWAALQTTGGATRTPGSLLSLATCYWKLGAAADGLAAVAEGLAALSQGGAYINEAELLRVRGELLLLGSADSQAEAAAAFREAIQAARSIGARAWELRAATSLARLLAGSGQQREARELLTAACTGLEGGAELPDVVEARELLTGL